MSLVRGHNDKRSDSGYGMHSRSHYDNKNLKETMATSSFRTLARGRFSARRFQTDRIIPPAILKDILETTLTSPSGFNLQPTQIMLVRCKEIKQNLANNAMLGMGNAYRVKDSSVCAVFLSDLEVGKRINRIIDLEREANMRDPNYMTILPIASSFLTGEGHAASYVKQLATTLLSEIQPMPSIDYVQAWSYKNTSLVAQTYVLAATSYGLSTCIMEGYDNRRVKNILHIPDRYDVPLIVATGYEFEETNNEEIKSRTPRLPFDEVVFGDTFGEKLTLDDDDDNSKI